MGDRLGLVTSDDNAAAVVAQLRTSGYPQAVWLAAGMEADVFALDDLTIGRLAKTPAAPSLTPLDHLMRGLANADLPFRVPVQLGTIGLADGRTMIRQPRLEGRSIGDFYDEDSGRLDPRAEQALVDLLSALHTVPAQRAITVPDLPLMGGSENDAEGRWPGALRALLAKQTHSHRALLDGHVNDLDALVRGCDDFLASRALAPLALQHGDICRDNVLVTEDCTLSAVLDWGYLTMLADPALEMALTAGFFDMYGPWASRTTGRLMDLFVHAFDVQREDLLRYTAVYALLGANAYSDTADGHFLWCVAGLERPDVRAAVLR